MVKKTNIILFVFSTVFHSLTAQSNDFVKAKNVELDKLRKEISALESELKSKSQKEKESLNVLEKISHQNLLLNKLINNLIEEEKVKQRQIECIKSQIDSVENQISNLKEKYSRYIVWLYKNMGTQYLKYFFNASSVNQAAVRYKYLQYISEENKKNLNRLKESKNQLSSLKNDLDKEVDNKEILIAQKQKEQSILQQKRIERKELIARLRRDQNAITNEIADKRRAEIEIKNLIAKLVERERQRKSRLLEKKAANPNFAYSYDYDNLANFSSLKGILHWPVKEGKVVRKFGENKNERLNTITLNYGIDVAVKGNDNVYAVAEGIVSAIDWIPGYGSVLILTHKDEFRTVYGHLSNINVSEGDKVGAGTQLGKVSDSLEGNILHFEIWNERNFQNPELWLVNK